MATPMEEDKRGKGVVSLWKHRYESLLRNNRPAWEEKPEVSTKSFPNGKDLKGLTRSFHWKFLMARVIRNDPSSKRYCVIEKRKTNIKHCSINHFPNNLIRYSNCTRLIFLLLNKPNPWILGFLVSLVS